MAVIAALKLDDFILSGCAACDTHRAHDRLRAGVDHANHLNIRHHGHDQIRQIRLALGRCAKAQTVFHGLLDCAQHLRIGVSQNHRSPRADIINVLYAVHICDVGALCGLDKARRHADRAVGAHRTIDTARHYFLCLFKQLFRGIHQPMSPFFIACASSLA